MPEKTEGSARVSESVGALLEALEAQPHCRSALRLLPVLVRRAALSPGMQQLHQAARNYQAQIRSVQKTLQEELQKGPSTSSLLNAYGSLCFLWAVSSSSHS